MMLVSVLPQLYHSQKALCRKGFCHLLWCGISYFFLLKKKKEK